MSEEKNVFVNEDALKPEYLPELLPGREKELREIADCLSPLTESRKARHLFLFGGTGTGKTACAKKILKELTESSKTITVYINCWQHSTRHAVLTQLSEALGEPMPRRGISPDEIIDRVSNALKNKNCLIALDEFDRMEKTVLYDFARANELFSTNLSILLISNYVETINELDERTRSSLHPLAIEFNRYSPEQLKHILSERAATAFGKGIAEKEAIALCAGFGARNNGDARVALQLLWTAGKNAEKSCADSVSAEHVKQAIQEQGELNPSKEKKLQNLNKAQEKILNYVRQKGEATTREIYSAFASEASERTLREYLSELEDRKLLSAREVNDGSGRKKIVKAVNGEG